MDQFGSEGAVLASIGELHLQTRYRHRFLVQHFVHTSSTSQNHWRLQRYHTPNDSPTTKDASLHIKGSKLLLSTSYDDCTTHQTTTTLPMVQLCTSRNKLHV